MSQPLTQRQLEILNFLKDFARLHGFPPAIREIGEHFKIAPPSVLSHLKALEKKGAIKREPMKPRCLEILDSKDSAAA